MWPSSNTWPLLQHSAARCPVGNRLRLPACPRCRARPCRPSPLRPPASNGHSGSSRTRRPNQVRRPRWTRGQPARRLGTGRLSPHHPAPASSGPARRSPARRSAAHFGPVRRSPAHHSPALHGTPPARLLGPHCRMLKGPLLRNELRRAERRASLRRLRKRSRPAKLPGPSPRKRSRPDQLSRRNPGRPIPLCHDQVCQTLSHKPGLKRAPRRRR